MFWLSSHEIMVVIVVWFAVMVLPSMLLGLLLWKNRRRQGRTKMDERRTKRS